ncbi:MAG: TerB family tellurite resistance protein [Bacteroidales bacterium]|nr:TerB family tellurite resistance protein [Bacteroidales bacterium]MCF8455875.1 TerB family tellurite resistance protein [Bacteroidales bacterium]
MFIIFGAKARLTKNGNDDELQNACPNCSNNLLLKDLKKWFTLFFIPIFPYSHVDTFYHCEDCDSTYRESAREALLQATGDNKNYQKEVSKLYSTTLVSCMTHMAGIDGHYSEEEEKEIENVKKQFPDFSKEINEAVAKMKATSNPEDLVFESLRKCSQVLTTEAILSIIGFCARVLKADGQIDAREEMLMKEYLLVCGIPKSKYKEIV